MRALSAHDLQVVMYKHAALLLGTFQHCVYSNVGTRTSNTGTSSKEIKRNIDLFWLASSIIEVMPRVGLCYKTGLGSVLRSECYLTSPYKFSRQP